MHWSKAVKEAASLKQSNLETQLHSLKSQVNPHFLFNSLNSLSSLIQSNPAQASTFVHKLSGVYRYLLQSNEQDLITVREELNFLRSYLHLLHTRFGPALQYQINVEEAVVQYLIPPITLQLLVENAVKHNIVAADKPLRIEVYNEGDQLLVKNNLQKRKIPVASNQVGLRNIFAKYQLLTTAAVEVQENDNAFVVALPFIQKPVYEGIDHRR
jgi:LytS/YehU family sensor histidine kinase